MGRTRLRTAAAQFVSGSARHSHVAVVSVAITSLREFLTKRCEWFLLQRNSNASMSNIWNTGNATTIVVSIYADTSVSGLLIVFIFSRFNSYRCVDQSDAGICFFPRCVLFFFISTQIGPSSAAASTGAVDIAAGAA